MVVTESVLWPIFLFATYIIDVVDGYFHCATDIHETKETDSKIRSCRVSIIINKRLQTVTLMIIIIKEFILGMHQKFPDTYWLDSPDKTITPFLQRTFLQQLCTYPCSETTCSILQPRLTWVCLQQPSWTLDIHLRRSQTGYHWVVSSLLWIGRSHRERGLANTLGVAAAAPHSHWESQLLLLLCAHWHCHDEEKGHGAGTKLRIPSGDSDACSSPRWLSVCPQEEWWWHGSIFWGNRQPFSSVCCMSFWGGDWKQPNRWLHLGFQIISMDPSFITCQHFPGQFWTASVAFLQHELSPLTPTLSSSVNEWGIHLAHRFLTQRWSCNNNMVTAVPMLTLCWISRVVTLGSALINFSVALMFVTVRTVAGVPHRCSSSKLRLPRLNSPNQKKTWVLDGAFLPKSCLKFSRASFDVSPLYSHRTLKSHLESSIFQTQNTGG